MDNQRVIVVHSSAIVQKGLADLLMHTCNVSVSQFISDYADVKLVIRLKKTTFFLAPELIIPDNNLFVQLKHNGNSIFLIAYNSKSIIPEIPCDGVLFIADSLPEIQKKLSAIYPAHLKNNNVTAELTPRETEVLKLVAHGNSNKETAEQLSISLHTVISHRKNICRKLEIKTTSGLTLYAVINNLII
jgi:DNA-binding CsgD family transcriptional regulator